VLEKERAHRADHRAEVAPPRSNEAVESLVAENIIVVDDTKSSSPTVDEGILLSLWTIEDRKSMNAAWRSLFRGRRSERSSPFVHGQLKLLQEPFAFRRGRRRARTPTFGFRHADGIIIPVMSCVWVSSTSSCDMISPVCRYCKRFYLVSVLTRFAWLCGHGSKRDENGHLDRMDRSVEQRRLGSMTDFPAPP
jgi:hypothetical protein